MKVLEAEEKPYKNPQESNISAELEPPITNILWETYKNLEENNIEEAKNKYEKLMKSYKTLPKEVKAKVFKDCLKLKRKIKESEEKEAEENSEDAQQNREEAKEEAEETDKGHLGKLSEYIIRMLKKGFPKERIEEKLLSVGWPKKVVDKEMSEIHCIFEQNKEPEIIKNIEEDRITEKAEKKEQTSKIKIKHKKPKTINTKKENIAKGGGKTNNKSKKRGDKMSKKMTKEGAGYLLRDVEPERCFWVNNGPVINSLTALQAAIKEMGEETFSYHVNTDKNDFSVWVSEVIGDNALAKDLSKAKTKETFLKRVKDRVASLKKAASR